MGLIRRLIRRGAVAVVLGAATVALQGSAVPPQPPPGRQPTLAGNLPAGLTGTIVFESDVAGRPAIYTLDLAVKRIAALAANPQATSQTPRWSPDGARVAFASNRAHYEGPSPDIGTSDYDVWVVNADGSNARRITRDPSNDNDPSWTADGRGLVFSSDRDSRGDLYRVDVASGETTRLTRHFVGRAIMPAASVAPERVAFAAQTLRAGAFWAYQVQIRDAQGAITALSNTIGGCWPRWSPDGRRLAHVRSNVGDAPSTLEVRDGADLSGSKVLTSQGLWSYYPAWSPAQSRLVYSVSPAHHQGENWDLAVVDIASGQWTRLTEGAGNDRLPDWKK